MQEQVKWMEKLYDFNQTRLSDQKRAAMLKEMFAQIGDHVYIEPPLHANWAGKSDHFGDYIYANYNLTMVDDTKIYLGDYTMFGPNGTLATAGHPVEPTLRKQGYQHNQGIHIGENCWFGAGAIVLPGVTIGDNTVIWCRQCRHQRYSG